MKIFFLFLWELMYIFLEEVYLWVFIFWVLLCVFILKVKLVLIVEILFGLRLSLDIVVVCYLVFRINVNFFFDMCFGKEDNLIFI